MNKELKETLARFDFVKKEPNKLLYYPEDLLTREEMWLLYDCITNLQNTNKNHSKKLIELGDKITNLQKENEILKENAIHNDKVVDKAKWNEMLYKSRNEKAIEYITSEETINMFSSINAREKWIKINHKLLNILQGDDKNE